MRMVVWYISARHIRLHLSNEQVEGYRGASELEKDLCETDFKKEFVLAGNVSESMSH